VSYPAARQKKPACEPRRRSRLAKSGSVLRLNERGSVLVTGSTGRRDGHKSE
jgi:hypothetical protein